MSALRIGDDEQLELAVDDLVALGARLDRLDVVATASGVVSIRHVDGRSWPVRVVARDAVGESDVRQLQARAARGRKVVVANQISGPARALLSVKGWSWLDRRFGAHLADGESSIEILFVPHPGVGTEGNGAVRTARPAADGPIRGRAGIAYAAAVLCRPEDPPSLRSVAAAIGMSPTSVSNAAKLLVDGGLIERGGTPSCPDLFDALAAVWGPLKVAPVASMPRLDDQRLQTHAGDLARAGWALGGDLAALELGAPLFSTDDRPLLWVPTQVELRRAERHLGSATWPDRVAVLAVAPTPLVCKMRRPPGPSGWPLVHPVFVALELARDPGRGREILKKWSPKGIRPVWR